MGVPSHPRGCGPMALLRHSFWSQTRIILKVKGDNVTALTLLIKMRPSGPTMAIIARELALRLVELSFPPDATRTPGVAHVIADRLSGGESSCPAAPGLSTNRYIRA